MEITITIPGEPAAKGRPKVGIIGGHARVFTPKKTRLREARVSEIAYTQMAGRPPMLGPLSVTITAVMGVPGSWSKKKRASALAGEMLPTKRPDIDNIWKLTTDGLNEIAYKDDVQVCELTMRKIYGPVPQTVIVIREMTPATDAGLPL